METALSTQRVPQPFMATFFFNFVYNFLLTLRRRKESVSLAQAHVYAWLVHSHVFLISLDLFSCFYSTL